MKHLPLIFILLILGACKKEIPETCDDNLKNQDEVGIDCGGVCTPCPIEYPETGAHGLNVLHGTDTTVFIW